MSELVVPATNEQGEEFKIVLKSPTAPQLKDAQVASSKAFLEAIKNKMMFREKLSESLREQGIWNDAKEAELKDITYKLAEGERKLARGASAGFKKVDAKKLAVDMRGWRLKQAELLTKTRELDEYTVESYAENAKFDFLVSACAFHDDGRNLFKSIDDYREKSSLPYAVVAATNLAKLLHNFNDNWEKDLPENKFLIKYGFVNDKLMFVNKDGKPTDEDGRLVNEDGRYVDIDGKLVDRDGNPVDIDGKPLEAFVEFDEEE